MKALKEKRISLRSLWRRGLVILSLFALVFASCSDSGSSDDGGGKIVQKVEFLGTIGPQYWGAPIILDGITAAVTYTDGTSYTETDTSKFTVKPPVATGYIDSTGGFHGMNAILLSYSGLEDKAIFVNTVGIIRNNTKNPDIVDNPTNDDGSYADGVELTGIKKMTTKTAFVDQERFDFAGLTLEANYIDDNTETIPFKDGIINWRVVPDYEDAKKHANGVGKGWVYITVGQNTYDWMGVAADGSQLRVPAGADIGGITVKATLDTVYTVNTLTVEPAPAFDLFYWEEDSSAAWIDRLISHDLVVTYKGSSTTNTYPIADLKKKMDIFHNENPGVQYKDFWVIPVCMVQSNKNPNPYDDYNKHVNYVKRDNPNPAVKIYYRGQWAEPVPVNVFTRLSSVAGVGQGEAALEFDCTPENQDNDRFPYGDRVPKNIAELCAKIVVTATFQAYNDTTKTKDYTVPYGAYTTDYATVWGGLKEGKTTVKPLKVYYTSPERTVENGIGAQTRNGSVAGINWKLPTWTAPAVKPPYGP
jgi:hypothetical protein